MLHSIWSEQICLAAKILHRADKELYCRPILEEQVYMSWDGLAVWRRDRPSQSVSDRTCRTPVMCDLEAGLPDVRRVDIPRKKVK